MRLAPLALAAAAALTVVGCGDGGRDDAGRFCEGVRADQDVLTGGVTTQADVDVLVTRYRELGDLAPLAIRDDWRTLTNLVEQAATLDPNDADAQATLTDLAYGAEPSARAVSEWVAERCGVVLRPPVTSEPGATSTTGEGSDTTAVEAPGTTSGRGTAPATSSTTAG